uniref:Troponin I n=1 Tax=Rhabditophanes sp. KR3021 TaxID=114890 RepID=A0AC35U952_9BILA
MSEDNYCSCPDEENITRYGGCQGENEDEAARKNEERERKKAEVRKRLEEAGNKKKAKKGFLTPERKKKLRKLLMMKAAEDLKQQQLVKEQERQKILAQRTMALPNVDSLEDQGKLQAIYEDIFAHVLALEEQKYDINYLVLAKDQEISELTIAVNDLRGKFVKPVLKKVSKYDNKFKKMADAKKDEKQDFRSNLKVVKKETVIDDLVAKKKFEKPEWSKKGGPDGENKEGKDDDSKPAKESTPEPAQDESVAEEEVVEEEEGEEEEEEEE